MLRRGRKRGCRRFVTNCNLGLMVSCLVNPRNEEVMVLLDRLSSGGVSANDDDGVVGWYRLTFGVSLDGLCG